MNYKNNDFKIYMIIVLISAAINIVVYCGLITLLFDNSQMLQIQIVNVISWICSVSFAYLANRKFILSSNKVSGIKSILFFYVARLGLLFVDVVFMIITVGAFELNDKLMKLFIQLLLTSGNYVVGKMIVFGLKRKNMRNEAKK